MYKKLRNSIKSLNLTQQLIGIIITISLVLLLLSYFILQTYIDSFVNSEMLKLIDRSQNQLVYRYSKLQEDTELLFDYQDPLVTHVIFDKTKEKPLISKPQELTIEKLNILVSKVDSQSKPIESYRFNESNNKELYVVKHIDDNLSIATIISKDYQFNFREILLQMILFIVLVTIIVVYLIFLVWISSIIQPLNQIVKYLTNIRNQEKGNRNLELDIDRLDEIGDVSRSIVEMEKEISRQEKVKMEMIHNISHDLKTPITTIKTYSESIKDGIYPYDTLEKSVDVILENADRLERKAHSLLLLNQIDAQEDMPVVLNPVEIKMIVDKVILAMYPIRTEINVIADIDDVIYQGDDESWRICIENLLENAFRYAKTQIRISVKQEGIKVYNDGEQMATDRIEKLFKPYEKGTNGQFGLGLSIVERLTTRMGYRIKGYNVLDGVEFMIEPKNREIKAIKHRKNNRKNAWKSK
ncbi:MAG: HAMP domain-containing histidine kinase [Erysipelothrix sp.]|nr:HAMP domain-containing histidine kinase [Erysipelothrix sp.]